MNPINASFWLPLLAAMLLSACATSVGNKTSLDQVEFALGETNKSEVAQVLGLPMAMRVEQGLELWAYQAAPELSGLLIPAPTGNNTIGTWGIDISKNDNDEFEKAAVIYGFDKDGTLLDIIDQRPQ